MVKKKKTSPKSEEERITHWYFRENVFLDLILPVISLIVSLIALITVLSNLLKVQ